MAQNGAHDLATAPRPANLCAMHAALARPLNAAAAAALALLLAACQASGPWHHREGAQNPLTGKIRDVAGARFIDQPTLVAELAEADFVLIGERHDNLDHHRLEAELTAALQAAAPRPRVVAFEMIPSDRQLELVEYLQVSVIDKGGGYAAIVATEEGFARLDAERRAAQLKQAEKNSDAPQL